MGFLIGTDEAGYGPNLGPLVITATVWEVPDGLGIQDLYRRLKSAVAATPAEAHDGCVAIGDSKALYQSGKGLRLLERGLLTALAALGRRPATWCEIWDGMAPGARKSLGEAPWYCGFDAALPLECDGEEIESLAGRLAAAFDRAGVRLADIRSRVIFEAEFNQLVEQHDSKGTMLSHATLNLIREMLEAIPAGPTLVVCDKHGGRNRYAPLLDEFFPESFIEIRREGRQLSVYQFGPTERRVEVRFQAKSESLLPTALASMASKYLRELAMRAFNDFWRQRVPGLRETAGYPEDAYRFKADIADAQAELRIDDRMLWRVK